jgi:hypothetical protein
LRTVGHLPQDDIERKIPLLWVDRIIGAALIAAAFPLWQLAGDFPDAARLFPRLTIGATAVLAAVMVLRSFVRAIAPVAEGEGARYLAALVRPVSFFALIAMGIAAAGFIGFFPAMAALCALSYLLLQVNNTKLYVAACCSLLIFVYLLFVLVLDVPLTSARLMSL